MLKPQAKTEAGSGTTFNEHLLIPCVRRKIGGFEVSMPSLRLVPGEILGVFGHSGSGKSTYLRALYEQLGFAAATLMHQSEALIDHLGTLQNIELGASAAGLSAEKGRSIISTLMEPLELEELLRRRVTTLSGGQRRRVYFAQVLSTDPGLLLLDEPFTGLGWKYEAAVRALILARQRSGRPTIVVSHDLEFLSQFATRILLVDEGRHAGWIYPSEPHPIEAEELWARTVGVTNVVEVSKLQRAFLLSGRATSDLAGLGSSIGFWRSWIHAAPPLPASDTFAGLILTQRPEVKSLHRLTFSHGESLGIIQYQLDATTSLELQVTAAEHANSSVLTLHNYIKIR